MTGLVPARHVSLLMLKKYVDARHEAGHDGKLVYTDRRQLRTSHNPPFHDMPTDRPTA